ncbi:PIN domain-containing protein [Candidatus Bipolaricaulota bacterium]|nr:PIN domain-containing protein [Candidatus Bipolaricaulota bacterium]
MTSKPPERLVVDANPMISALLGGAALRAFWNEAVKEWATTQFTVNEVLSYLPRLASKIHVPEEMLRLELELLPLRICKKASYRDLVLEAKRRIAARDANDVDLLALALKLDYPIWTNDQDFEQTGTTLYTTAKLLKSLL